MQYTFDKFTQYILHLSPINISHSNTFSQYALSNLCFHCSAKGNPASPEGAPGAPAENEEQNAPEGTSTPYYPLVVRTYYLHHL